MYDVKGAGSADLEPRTAAIMGLFQYMIGNTDYSVPVLHNVELMARDTSVYPIAYDFDFSGAVNARYATVDPSLSIRRVRDRLYRGYCVPSDAYAPAFALFKAKRDSIYALYRDPIGRLLTGQPHATAEDAVWWLTEICARLQVPPLRDYGVEERHIPELAAKAAKASSTKAKVSCNPTVAESPSWKLPCPGW